MKKLLLLSAACFALASMSYAQRAKVTVRVVDLDGVPVENAKVGLGVSTAIAPGYGWGAGKGNSYSGMTDTNGLCVLSGHGNGGSMSVGGSKDGYYPSGGYLVVFTNVVWGLGRRWEPWNPTIDVVLKKVSHPVPMHAKRLINETIPVVNEPVGYDLMAGDWTAPHGKGETADFVFDMERHPTETNTYWLPGRGESWTNVLYDEKLTVSFSNPGDGFVFVPVPKHGVSSLRLEGPAPETGYTPVLVKTRENFRKEDATYYLRIRSELDGDGTVVKALYGKIYGDFAWMNASDLTFTHYLNPVPNDRNVEFDSQRNLLEGGQKGYPVSDP